MKRRALVACEFSGVVRDAFAALGWDAWSCDLLSSETPGNHIQADVFQVLNQPEIYGQWDLMLSFWSCTLLCNSGVRWLYGGKGQVIDDHRWGDMEVSGRCFEALAHWPSIPFICAENPIPHKHAKLFMGAYSQVIQPWQHGHGETKATCLWLKNLPSLKPSNIVEGRTARVHRASPGPNRWKERSRTLPGVAKALAEQFTAYIETRNRSSTD